MVLLLLLLNCAIASWCGCWLVYEHFLVMSSCVLTKWTFGVWIFIYSSSPSQDCVVVQAVGPWSRPFRFGTSSCTIRFIISFLFASATTYHIDCECLCMANRQAVVVVDAQRYVEHTTTTTDDITSRYTKSYAIWVCSVTEESLLWQFFPNQPKEAVTVLSKPPCNVDLYPLADNYSLWIKRCNPHKEMDDGRSGGG